MLFLAGILGRLPFGIVELPITILVKAFKDPLVKSRMLFDELLVRRPPLGFI